MPLLGHLEASAPTNFVSSKSTRTPVRADWSAYATAYDLLSEHNPAYQLLLREFEEFLQTIDAPGVIYDIGGGTGNYSEIAARNCPESEIKLVEPDNGMRDVAREKLAAHANVAFDPRTLEEVDESGTADLVVCVHALYAMPEQRQRLNDLRRLLRPGGWLYLVDLGRHMNVADWRRYLFAHLRQEHGFFGALRIFWQGRVIATQNATILQAQKKGVYWTHTEAEIASMVADAGFDIIRQDRAYRGYSDLLVCRAVS